MNRTKTPPEGGALPNRRPEAAPRPRFRGWALALGVVGFTILVLLGTGLLSGGDAPGGALRSNWSLLILLVLLPCMLMPLVFLVLARYRGGGAAERDRKDDGTGR